MKHIVVRLFAIFVTLATCGAVATAQQPKKVPRIGYLAISPLSSNTTRIEAFRQGLRELGYVEGKNIIIEWRSGEGNEDRVPALVTELLHVKVDVVVTGGPGATRQGSDKDDSNSHGAG